MEIACIVEISAFDFFPSHLVFKYCCNIQVDYQTPNSKIENVQIHTFT